MMRKGRLNKSLFLVLAVALLTNCEGVTGEGGDVVTYKDMTTTKDVTQTAGDAGSSTTDAGTTAPGYRYIAVRDGVNDSLVDCDNENPGADIDAIGIFTGDSVKGYCQVITYKTAEEMMRAGCDEEKNPPAENLTAATGAPDVCDDEECIISDGVSERYIWLNGGEIICDLGEGVTIEDGDTIVVYEVYNPSNADKTKEKYFVDIATSADGPWTEIGEGLGIAPVTINFSGE